MRIERMRILFFVAVEFELVCQFGHRRQVGARRKMPAGSIAKSEVDACSKTPDSGALQLFDLIAGRIRIAVIEQQSFALQHRALVRKIEEIRRERDAEAIHEPEILGGAKIELVD